MDALLRQLTMSELSSNPRFFQVFNAMIADIGVYSFAVYTGRVNQNGGWNFKQPFWIPHFGVWGAMERLTDLVVLETLI